MKKLFGRKKGGLSCEEVMEVLQSYLDGETDAETTRKVIEHNADCANCELESKVYQDIKSSLARRTEPVDPTVMATLQNFSDRLVSGEIE